VIQGVEGLNRVIVGKTVGELEPQGLFFRGFASCGEVNDLGMGEYDGSGVIIKGFFPYGMGETVLKHPDHHVGIKGGLDLKVVGDVVDADEDVAGAAAEFLVDSFGSQVLDRAVQGIPGVEQAVVERDDCPVGEVKELFEHAVEDVGRGTLWLFGAGDGPLLFSGHKLIMSKFSIFKEPFPVGCQKPD
jgi:hypothetical protein